MLYDNGPALAKDEAKLATLYRQGCDLGDGPGCFNLAAIFETGHGVSKDKAQAAVFQQKACALGVADACK